MKGRIGTTSSAHWRRIASIAGFVVLFAVVAIFLLALVPSFAGADHSYVVKSDSMSPAIKAGAVVFVSEVPTDSITEDAVITFEQGDDQRVTHRVVEVRGAEGTTEFVTKGDANEDPDPSPVPASAVVGRVTFHVPLMGYVVAFANTQLGLLTLVVVPALLLIVLELRDFWREMSDEDGGEAP